MRSRSDVDKKKGKLTFLRQGSWSSQVYFFSSPFQTTHVALIQCLSRRLPLRFFDLLFLCLRLTLLSSLLLLSSCSERKPFAPSFSGALLPFGHANGAHPQSRNVAENQFGLFESARRGPQTDRTGPKARNLLNAPFLRLVRHYLNVNNVIRYTPGHLAGTETNTSQLFCFVLSSFWLQSCFLRHRALLKPSHVGCLL